ncbi:MAG: hypothetical protein K2I42_03850 [Anaeroplasmataceae bacterium]|nr:hypothetical protein [Anaeroplasmataceae bacterium]
MDRNEEIIKSWIRLSSIIKNNRIIEHYNYNEAIILNLVYEAYQQQKGVYLKDILHFTKMLKSLANRTINQLVEQDFVYRKKDEFSTKQIIFFNKNKEKEYLLMHQFILNKVQDIVSVLGDDDTDSFIRIVKKLNAYSEKL